MQKRHSLQLLDISDRITIYVKIDILILRVFKGVVRWQRLRTEVMRFIETSKLDRFGKFIKHSNSIESIPFLPILTIIYLKIGLIVSNKLAILFIGLCSLCCFRPARALALRIQSKTKIFSAIFLPEMSRFYCLYKI